MSPNDSPVPKIVRDQHRPDVWRVYEPDGRYVASYRTRERARSWMMAAGYQHWREESWTKRGVETVVWCSK